MLMVHQNIRAIHLSIDPQTTFLNDLSEERRRSFAANLRNFADRIDPIPTFWVGTGLTFKVYSGQLTEREGKLRVINELGLGTFPIRDHECIIEKNDENVFLHPKILKYLKQRYPNLGTIILTGMNTRLCLPHCAEGTLSNKLHCDVIYDLLADQSAHMLDDSNPLWHKEMMLEHDKLRNIIQKNRSQKLRVIDQKTFLATLHQYTDKPPAPQRTNVLARTLTKLIKQCVWA